MFLRKFWPGIPTYGKWKILFLRYDVFFAFTTYFSLPDINNNSLGEVVARIERTTIHPTFAFCITRDGNHQQQHPHGNRYSSQTSLAFHLHLEILSKSFSSSGSFLICNLINVIRMEILLKIFFALHQSWPQFVYLCVRGFRNVFAAYHSCEGTVKATFFIHLL